MVLLLVATGLVLLPAAVTLSSASAATTQITEGHLDWGFKRSWRNYIGVDGTTLSGGVVRNEDGTFRFPVESGTYDDATRTTVISFAGAARFQLYYEYNAPGRYALDSQWSDLELTISPTEQLLRGDYQGYPRDDPGGELETLEHVVLAKMDIGTATTSFDGGTSTWADIFAVAGSGFSALYPEGTVVDPLTVTYDGPGGAPDLGERWAQEGAPILAEGARWTSPNPSSITNVTNEYYSARSDVVHVPEILKAGMPTAVFTLRALDADTLQPVGNVLTKAAASGSAPYMRTAFDAATDTVFHLTGKEGAGKVTTNVYASTWDRETSSYTTVNVGQLRDSYNTGEVVPVTGFVWNERAHELGAIVRRSAGTAPGPYDAYQLYRFSLGDDGWQRTVTDLVLPSTGEYAGATSSSNPLGDGGGVGVDAPSMGVARDGSYVVTSPSGYFSFADGHKLYADASHIAVGAEGTVTVEFIAGTRGTRATTGGTYYGFGSVAEGVRDATGGAALWLHSSQAMDAYVLVDIDDGHASTLAPIVPGDVDAIPPTGTSTLGLTAGTDQTHRLTWLSDIWDPQQRNLRAYLDGAEVAAMPYAEIRTIARGYGGLEARADGSLYVGISDAANGGRSGIALLAFRGITATVTGQPSSESVALGAAEATRAVTFTSTATSGEPASTRQWQVKPAGMSSFSDVPGENGETLTVAAAPGMDGTQYRAVYTNTAGSVVSDVATLSVDYAPRVVVDVRDQSVTEGADATFLAGFDGFPEPALTWQRRVDGFWTNIEPDDDNYAVSDSSLTIKDTITEQSGALFRVRARNSVATTYSRAARLTVVPASTIPAAGLDLTGVVLEWSGSEELQAAPPYGAVNYLSAGVSDGTQATYRAEDGDGSIWRVGPGGVETRATYATRAAHIGTGAHQLVRLGAGKAHLDRDGSATVDWRGSWSVNFYGGLVPFTMTDPALTVDADGTGKLTADLSGYASSMENPNEKRVIPPVADVVVATFRDVEIDPSGDIAITPDYAGVAIDVPAGQSAQNRTSPGWGAWPQAFVDFQFKTGLSSYWYSSGGAADPDKVPSAFAVDFTDAVEGPGPGVAKATSTTTVTAGTVAYGRAGKVGVRVTPASGAPSGTVAVTVGGKQVTGVLVAGVASIALPPALKPGKHPVTAAYAGDATTQASSGSATVRVTKAHPRVSLKLAKKKVSAGSRCLVRVVATIPGGLVPATGKVVIRDGRKVVATKRLTAASKGKVSIRLPRLTKGKHRLIATLLASPVHVAASSRRSTLRVR
jgi:hypothetical protein